MDIENFLSSAFAYAETSKRTYRNVITSTLNSVQNPASLTAAELVKLIENSGWGNARQCVALAACKKYLAWKYGQAHPALSAKLKRLTGRMQNALSRDQAIQLLASFDRYTARGARDLAMAALALDTGLRASELCHLKQADTDTEHNILQVVVKGGQWESAVFSPETSAHIEHWKRYREQINGQTFLFVAVKTGKGLTSEGLRKIVRGWGRGLGIKLTTHDFRRSFAVLSTTETNTPERILLEGGRWKSAQMIYKYTRTIRLDAMRKHLIIPKLK